MPPPAVAATRRTVCLGQLLMRMTWGIKRQVSRGEQKGLQPLEDVGHHHVKKHPPGKGKRRNMR